jgi:hypothetical protein
VLPDDGFQFSIARLVLRLLRDAESILAIYLQAITAPVEAGEHARDIVEAAKRISKAGRIG